MNCNGQDRYHTVGVGGDACVALAEDRGATEGDASVPARPLRLPRPYGYGY